MPCFSTKRRFGRHHRFVSYANGDSSDATDLSHMQTASRQPPPICFTCKRRVFRHHRFVSYANGESSDTTDLSPMQTASRQTPPICLLCKRRVLRHHRFVSCTNGESSDTTDLSAMLHKKPVKAVRLLPSTEGKLSIGYAFRFFRRKQDNA